MVKNKKFTITGCAGFIGYSVTKFLLKKNFKIIGVDAVLNINVSLNVTDQEGSFDSMKTFHQSASSKQGKKWIQTRRSSTDRIIEEK